MKNWFTQLQGDAYALSLYPDEDTEQSAREFLRTWLNVDRLPNGTEIWSD